MDKSALGRVLDPGALDACEGARARLSIEVPAAWLTQGAELVINAPARLACARCDGGGCDACARSGVLRVPVDARDRTLRVTHPAASEPRGIALRIPDPFGPEHEIAQLLLEVRAAAHPSASVTRIVPPPQPSGLAADLAAGHIPFPILAAAVIAAVLFALFGR